MLVLIQRLFYLYLPQFFLTQHFEDFVMNPPMGAIKVNTLGAMCFKSLLTNINNTVYEEANSLI